jgi:hypothetical protein
MKNSLCTERKMSWNYYVIAECKIESVILNKVQLTILFIAESQVPVAVQNGTYQLQNSHSIFTLIRDMEIFDTSCDLCFIQMDREGQ